MNTLVYGGYACGKTTYAFNFVKEREAKGEHTLVVTNSVCKQIYCKPKSDYVDCLSEKDLTLSSPIAFATELINRFILTFPEQENLHNPYIVIDSLFGNQQFLEFYPTILSVCNRYNISVLCTNNSKTDGFDEEIHLCRRTL